MLLKNRDVLQTLDTDSQDFILTLDDSDGDLGVEGSTSCAALQLGSSLPQNLVKDDLIQPCCSSLCVKGFTFYSHKLLLFENKWQSFTTGKTA